VLILVVDHLKKLEVMDKKLERNKCGCGKTKDRNGFCDGSHKKTKQLFEMNNLPFPHWF